MYKSRFLELAKIDLKETASWYNKQQLGLGRKFIKEVRIKISKIEKNPLGYAIRFNATRGVLLDIFPYLIFYEVFENQKLVIISAVLSSNRNPGFIRRRSS
ncbi:type II toxin-antitoxin system RelE/ParE family toxin [Algoriphagus persicinus]|uniref:type II toxin-antitoxin system RelE/ParE family toxin n=1 Tax=Algoriphagus persicinus TaxID=3108754 RepID=UPI002B38ACE7|nr:type II toxin-antitoxin system RelE/ParE family toxin [Algoriphagus sp. E1-3-M2]MEB2784848.1 type II toxin-antitoxin system RelE/ParE family toxin [Algoriphagus sp. E1-3-M2]